jgi:tetratricopeptide (TPR) repeat protein
MAVIDPGAEVRIRELRRRVTQDPTSPLFLALAEECRAAGNLPEAILILEKGVSTYARYVSAQVALARAYLEAGRTDEAIAMFTKALASDRGNPVSARSLADIYLSRGERLEAVKKYKLYRALSGDRSVDGVIEGIERDLGETPETAAGPSGRVLADLYLSQGHYSEAAALYGQLAGLNPDDGELARLRKEAEARLAAAGGVSPSPAPEKDRAALRAAKVQALKRWLSVIQDR